MSKPFLKECILKFSGLIALVLTTLFSFTRYFHRVFKLSRLSFKKIEGFSYTTTKWFVAIANIKFGYHWPSREAPYVLSITIEQYEYQDEVVHISVGNAVVKIWLFPAYFGITAGPWIETKAKDFVMQITSSKHSPWFVDIIRRNIIHSVVNGDTIRLNSMNMKTVFGQLGVPDVEHTVDDVAKIGLRHGEINDELRVTISTSQWHVYAPWSGRIYSYDNLQAELKKNWTEKRGSLVLIAKECRWTKVRDFEQQDRLRQMTSIKAFFSKLFSIPHQIYEACWNPMCMVDVYVVNAGATFTDFRLRDAEMFKTATDKAKEEFVSYSNRHPGVIENTAWEMLIGEIMLALRE